MLTMRKSVIMRLNVFDFIDFTTNTIFSTDTVAMVTIKAKLEIYAKARIPIPSQILKI